MMAIQNIIRLHDPSAEWIFVAAADNAEQRLAWINTLESMQDETGQGKAGTRGGCSARYQPCKVIKDWEAQITCLSHLRSGSVFTKPGNKEVKGMEGKRTSPASGKPRKVTNRQRMSAQLGKRCS